MAGVLVKLGKLAELLEVSEVELDGLTEAGLVKVNGGMVSKGQVMRGFARALVENTSGKTTITELNRQILEARLENTKLKNAKQKDERGWNLTRTADLLQKKTDTLKKWVARGCPAEKKGRTWEFEIADVFDWRVQAERPASVQGDGEEITLDEARRNESIAKTEKIHLEMESIRKVRIPIEVMNESLDQCLAAMKAVVKRSKLPPGDKEEVFRELREVPRGLKW